MPTAVQPTMEKLLPPTDAGAKKTQQKQPSESFDTALDKARPKRAEAKDKDKAEKPAAKKTTHNAKAKGNPGKEAKVAKNKDAADDPAETEAEDQAGDATSSDSQEEAPEEDAKPVAKGQKTDPRTQTDAAKVLIADQNAPSPTQPTPQAVEVAATNQQPQPQAQAKTDEVPEKTEAKEAAPNAPVAQVKAVKKSPNPIAAKQAKKAVDDATDDDQAEASQDSSEEDQASTDGQQAPQAAAKPVTSQRATQHAHHPAETVDAEAPAQLKQPSPTPQAQAASSDQSDDLSVQAVDTDSDQSDAPPAIDSADEAAAHAAADAVMAMDLSPKASTPQASAPVHAPPPPPPAPPEVRFAEANHPQIVSGIRGQLLPEGGTMHIRLDPPELGALQVSIHMQDGVMTASFQTSNDEATKVLSHSLAQLKHVLEGQGVSVDKLHVTQAPRDQQTSNSEDNRQQGASDNSEAKQEQQRREVLQRMWRRLTDGSDPLDMVA